MTELVLDWGTPVTFEEFLILAPEKPSDEELALHGYKRDEEGDIVDA